MMQREEKLAEFTLTELTDKDLAVLISRAFNDEFKARDIPVETDPDDFSVRTTGASEGVTITVAVLLGAFVLGVVKGAGQETGKQIVQAVVEKLKKRKGVEPEESENA